MAKTASQIIAENKRKRAQEAAITASRDAIHQDQMELVAKESQAKTAAILQKAAENAYDSATRSEMENALKRLIKKKDDTTPQTAAETTTTVPGNRGRSYLETAGTQQQATPYAAGLQAQQQALTPEQKAEKERKAAEEYQKQQQAAAKNQRIREADMQEIRSWSDEDRGLLESYIQEKNERDDPLAVSNPFRFLIQNKKVADKYAPLTEKYGEERLKELAETYSIYLTEQEAKALAEQTAQAVDSVGGAIGHNALGVGARLVGGPYAMLGRMEEAFNRTGRYDTLATYTPRDMLSLYGNTVVSETAQNISGDEYDENGQLIKDGGKLRQIGSLAYQGGMAALDSTARLLVSGGNAGISAALAASGTFSQTMSEASRQGATPEQAVALAVTKSGIEYLTEKLPTDELLKLFKGKNTLSKVGSILTQAFLVEPTSEEASLFLGVSAEASILGEKSNQAQRIGDLIANGMSREEAEKQYYTELWKEAAQTYVVSAFSGGLSATGAALLGRGNTGDTGQEPPVQPQPEAQTNPVGSIEEAAALMQQQTPVIPTEDSPEMRIAGQVVEQAMGVQAEQAQETAVSEETAVNVKSANTALTEENREKNTLAYELATKLDSIRDMSPVAQLTGNEFKKTDDGVKISDKLRDFFRSIGNKVFRNGFGDVELSEYGIGAFLTHKPINRARAVSMAAVPNVIQNGRQIGYDPNWKGRGYPSYIFAAPVKVAGADVYVAAVVNQLPDNKFYLSEMVDSQGNYVRIEESPSGNSKNGLPMGLEVQQGRGYAGPEGLSKGSSPTADAEPMLLSTDIVPDAGMEVKKNPGNFESPQAVDTSEQSAEDGQGIKGTGAAEADFSGKPSYNATLAEDNAQADRRDDVRPMELPKQDVNGGNISAVTGNVYGSKITPDELASLMEEPTARGDFTYAKITNDQATQKATETIASAGTWENAYDSWKQSVTVGNAGAEMSARGALFLNHAAQQGNKQLWLETLHYMQKLGTNTAQGLQAFRIIRTLKPVDKIEFVKMSVEKMATEVREKHGIDLEIDQTLIDEFEQAETDADRDAVLEDIQQNVADQIPSTFLDKWTALRYMNMLGNLKTNVRNVAGNIGSAAVYRIKDTIATAMETIAHTISGGKIGLTKSLFVDPKLLNACKEDFRQFKETVSAGGKYGERMSATSQFEQGVQDKRRIFKNPLLEGYRKGTNWMMNNKYFGDEAFGRAAYARALAGYLQANGVTGSDLSEVDGALLDKARAYAIKEAQEATFHDNSALAKIVSKVQKDTGILGQGIMPFTKTPANVLTRAEEFSPLGLINSTVKSIQKARGNENITGADVINSWAKTMTGVGLFALGAAMIDQGLLTGGPDEDEEKAAFDELNGQQNYAIQLPDGTNYTIDWLSPAAMPMFMGAQFWKMLSSDRDLTFADVEQVFTSIADPMIQMSMLQGLNDSLDGIKYSDNNLGQFFINAAVSYLTQGLTNTLMGQFERSTEENRQTTYIDKDSDVPQWLQRTLGKASQKIPGWDYQQTDYRNAWGQTEKNEGGLLYNLLSPGYISKEESTAVSEELHRLREATGENVFPQEVQKVINYTDSSGVTHTGYNLSAKELETMQRVQGETAAKVIAKMVETADYAALSDAQKAEAIKTVYSYAREKAEIAAVPDHHGYSNAWMKALPNGGEASAIIARTCAASLNSAAGDLQTAWGESWNDSAYSEDLKWAYDTFRQLKKTTQANVLDQAEGMTANYIEARSGGVSHEEFLDVAKLLDGIKPETGYNNARAVQKAEIVAGYAGISENEKTLLIKQQVSNAQDKNIDDLKAMGYGVEDFAKLYRDYEDYTSGTGKKKRTCTKWAEDYGITYGAAEAIYEVFYKS